MYPFDFLSNYSVLSSYYETGSAIEIVMKMYCCYNTSHAIEFSAEFLINFLKYYFLYVAKPILSINTVSLTESSRYCRHYLV